MSELTLPETTYSVQVVEQVTELTLSVSNLDLIIDTQPVIVLDLSFNSPGPKGDPSSFLTTTSVAGESISSYSAVVILNNVAYKADITNLAHASLPIYIAVTAASFGGPITLATAGAVTTTPPTAAGTILQRVGVARTTGELDVLLDDITIRA
jgi:hypothetical protein